MAVSPVEQFRIESWVPIKLGNLDVSFTNSAMFMVLAVILVSALFLLSVRRRALVPGRWQSVSEMLYEVTANMVRDNAGVEGRRYFPFVFTMFLFLLCGNLIGMVPYTFTFTSHIAVTFALAIFVFIAVTIIGFARHGLHFLRMFFPHGAPLASAVILIPIELISYLSRPFSLAIRLAANMMVGHVILKLLAGFIIALGIAGILPMAFLGAITMLEFFIAVLQAYVFTILTCVYLRDAIHMH